MMKDTNDVALMEVKESTIGIRTRAKTLALQRLKSSPFSPAISASNASDDASCYLQLRTRRLQKVSTLRPQKNASQKSTCKQDSEASPTSPVSSLGVSIFDTEAEEDSVLGIEASFGENSLDCETRERVTRESTPCSMIRDVDVVTPPGSSTTRQTSSVAANRRAQNGLLRDIPSTYEMEEFFNLAEQQQQRQFVDKYNFDVFTDMPLLGRYEWLRV